MYWPSRHAWGLTVPEAYFKLIKPSQRKDTDSEIMIQAGIAPHRQLNQKATAELDRVLRDKLHKLAAAFPSLVQEGRSCFEKHGLALFLSACTESELHDRAHLGFSHLNPTCKDTGEICHLHATVSCSPYRISTGFRLNILPKPSPWRAPAKSATARVLFHRHIRTCSGGFWLTRFFTSGPSEDVSLAIHIYKLKTAADLL